MITRGIRGLWQTARRLKRVLERRALILLYHRVTELRSDPWSLAVTPRHFSEHIEILRGHGWPIQLQQLAKALVDDNLPYRSVVVTFDDGYADILDNARPVLERYDVPATAFLTTGSFGTQYEYWWDTLDRLLLQPGGLPDELHLRINGRIHAWRLGEAVNYRHDAAQRYRSWKAGEQPPTARHMLYRSLWELLHPLVTDEREKALDALLIWAGMGRAGRPMHRTLSVEEVAALARDGLIEIGAHTMTHPSLAALPADLQRDEIQQSKARLEELLGWPVTSFAYPYGKRTDYTTDTVAVVRGTGFACACSNVAGVVDQSADLYQLPRMYVHDWDGEEFSRRLARWFHH